ncbi:MAG TPA: ABC transporter permease [Vicinamibacterales bacterium]|jgi:putative ABC transport system permease protein
MSRLPGAWHLLGRLLRRESRKARLDEEIQFHLDRQIERHLREGLAPDEARRRALIEFGGISRARERTRDQFRLARLEGVLREVRYAARSLRRAPGFTIAAILTLSLGIGATTAMFTVLHATLLAPLPYQDPGRRVMIWSRWTGYDKTWVSEAEVVDYRRLSKTLTDVAAWTTDEGNLTGGGEPIHVAIGDVTANTFRVLGVTPILGRTFTPGEDQAQPAGEGSTGVASPVAVLSYGLWQRRYGRDPSVLGQTIDIDGSPATIVGVMGRRFQLPTDFSEDAATPTQLWRPLGLNMTKLDRGDHGYYAVATLAPGATAATATAELGTITANFTREGLYPAPMHFGAFALPLDAEVRGAVRPAVLLLAVAVTFLLLIACANVANLLLVRTDARQRELALRHAVGAGARHVLAPLMAESCLLSMAGAAFGLLVAKAAIEILLAVNPQSLPPLAPVTIDDTVLGFAALLAVATTMIFGLVPASRAMRPNLVDALKDGGSQSVGDGRQRLRGLLVVGEMAMAVLLVTGAGLMIRSLGALQQIELGFNPAHALTARLSLPKQGYESPGQVTAFLGRFRQEVESLPGVTSAGFVRSLPLEDTIGDWGVRVDGYTAPPDTHALADWQVISPGAIAALGERIVAGRDIQPSDTAGGQHVALVNETMARAYWPNGRALGGRFKMGNDDPSRPWITVVGIVADVHHNGMTGHVKTKFYRPASQFTADAGGSLVVRNYHLVVRTSGGSPLALAPSLRDQLQAIDPAVPLSGVETLDDVVDSAMASPRLAGFLLGAFAAVALVLAAIGIYGVLSYLVSQRAHEIGIRMAIGADSGLIARMVLGRGFTLAALGIVIGLSSALLLTRFMQGLLYGVTPLDPVTFAAVPIVLLAVAALASYLPARRATRVDPIIALREE